MLRLSKATHDQLEILLCVNDRVPDCVPVKVLCASLGLTSANGLKLATRLVQAGLLRTKRGPGGGVMLARPAASISLGAAIRLLEEKNTSGAVDIGSRRDRSVNFMNEALVQFINLLDRFTLADLAAGRVPRTSHIAGVRPQKTAARATA